MIYGIGTDIVAISRLESIYSNYGDKFAKKILSTNELTKFGTINNYKKKIAYIATRWAAKEAIVKALGTGFRNGLYLTEIIITNTVLGQPKVSFSTIAQKTINNIFLNKKLQILLSLSDDQDYALAYVVIELL